MVEHRRSRRKRAQGVIQVVNAITEEAIGHIGNLSIDGMMLVSNRPLREDALFQFAFALPTGVRSHLHRLEIGVHEQWSEPASVAGQYWSGFRIIDISTEDERALDFWLNSPGIT